jgi:acetylornithine deacetylase/succinyl-diaminopimelate desuccinylase-like protein
VTDDLRARVDALMPRVREELEALVRIESVWDDPERRPQVHRSAAAVADLFRRAGFASVDVVGAGGAPAVIARHPAPDGAPTVLLYAHHDVQPEGVHAQWSSPPFEPTERDGRLFGRGTADDKAGIAAHLAAFLAHDGGPPVGVTVFVEGEEESGSESLPALLEAHRDDLASDVIVIADSTNWDIGVPSLTTSLRGLADCLVEVRTLDHSVHSGMWGGVVPDALTAMARLLSTLHDDEGNVAVEGLGSGSATAPDLEYPVERLRAEAGVADGVELFGTGSLVERMWAKPAIAVLGIDAPRATGASNTLVPVARAKVSLRVPPGTNALEARAVLVRHLEEHAPWGARVTVTPGDVGEPFAVDARGFAYEVVRSCFRDAWDGTEAVDIGTGGSIPFIELFARTYPDAAILVTGVEDPDTRAHGTDEGLHLGEFARVCLAEALLLERLA